MTLSVGTLKSPKYPYLQGLGAQKGLNTPFWGYLDQLWARYGLYIAVLGPAQAYIHQMGLRIPPKGAQKASKRGQIARFGGQIQGLGVKSRVWDPKRG